ncbi:MAG TPA: PRK06851 family protein [Bacillota bacterium]|nr:PRK06851 family protein [Bacillota bacterium]
MPRGKIKKVFPGSNSAYGFYSFYDQIIGDDAARIFVIKGGPGVGKSTFMTNIARELIRLGYDVEYHCCSADNSSLDGIVIPRLNIACIDGTAPHVVDPKNPGAVDEIIHLGEFWNEAGMIAHRDSILKANREISRLYRRAYRYLAAAKLFLDEVEDYYREHNALDTAGLARLALEVTGEIFGSQVNERQEKRVERHLFATAITPDGPVSYLETIVDSDYRRYIISGDDGTGKNELIARIKDAAVMRNYYVEVYHCALDPHKIDHVIIPQLKVAVLNSVTPHLLEPEDGDRVIETDGYVKNPGDALEKERDLARYLYQESFDAAISYIYRSHEVHDELEKYYIPNMRFHEINRLGKLVLEKILSYSEQIKPA